MEVVRLLIFYFMIFSGNFLDWFIWKVFFEIVIEKRIMNFNEKILYFLQYLFGVLKKIVEGYQFFKIVDVYLEVKKIFEK